MNKDIKNIVVSFTFVVLAFGLMFVGVFIQSNLETEVNYVKCYDAYHNEIQGLLCEEESVVDDMTSILSSLMVGIGMWFVVIFTIITIAFASYAGKKKDAKGEKDDA